MIERRRSPIRQSPIGDVALPGLCSEPGCEAAWVSEDLGPLFCAAHYRHYRRALAVQVAPSSPEACPRIGVEGGASREAGAMTAAIEATPGGRSLPWSRRLPIPA